MRITKIKPLQQHVKTEPAEEASSFLRAFSVVSPVIIYYVVSSLANILFVAWFSWYSGNNPEREIVAYFVNHSRQISAVVNGVATAVGCLFVLPLFKKEYVVWKFPEKRGKDVGFVIAVSLTSAIALNYLLGVIQQYTGQGSYQEIAETQFSLPVWLALIVYGVISPFAEEVVFRGLVYNRFRRQYGVFSGILVSAFLFGIYHGNLVQAVYGTVLGIMIAVLYERFGTFWVPVIIHAAANIGIYCLLNRELVKNTVMTAGGCAVCMILTVIFLWILLNNRQKNNN